MTHWFRYLVIIVLAWPVEDTLAQYAELSDEADFQSNERRYGHLEYFGFYASAMGFWNFTQELADFTNLTWIHVGSASNEPAAIDAMVERMREAREAGVRAVLSIEPFLFSDPQGHPRPDEDTEDFLVELRARIELEGLFDTLLMIYPKDEPFREFVRYRDPNFIEQYVTGEVYEEIHADLVQVNGVIERVFPEIPIGVILSGYNLDHNFFSIPENYDWVGFDCYDNLFVSCDDRSFVDHYQRLLDFMQPHQRLMAVPEAWASDEVLNRADWPDVLLSRLRHHYEIALNEPRFVAFVPFIWSFESDQEVPGVGLNRIPELFDDGVSNRGSALVDYVVELGRQIKTGQPAYPNMAWDETEDVPWRPQSRIRAGIMSITGNGVVSAWAIDDGLPHKNLRVRVTVRDAAGRLLHKSRPERTFVHDPGLGQANHIGRRVIGLHGYRYTLPQKLMTRHGGQTLTVELLAYGDGATADLGFLHAMELSEASRILTVAPPAGVLLPGPQSPLPAFEKSIVAQ